MKGTKYLQGEDLTSLEEIWTGEMRVEDEASESSRTCSFYALMEFTTFLNGSWDMVREITYLAISKLAFDILVTYANFKRTRDRIERVPETFVDAVASYCARALIASILDLQANSW